MSSLNSNRLSIVTYKESGYITLLEIKKMLIFFLIFMFSYFSMIRMLRDRKGYVYLYFTTPKVETNVVKGR